MAKDKPEITEEKSTAKVEKVLTEEESQIKFTDEKNNEFFEEDDEVIEVNFE